MNLLLLKEMNSDRIVYMYQPEGKGECGEIEYSFSDQEAHISLKASDDETGYYAHKATNKVTECVNKKNLPMEFIQAWY